MTDERKGSVGEGIRTGMGMLMAFKEAVEETLEETLRTGDVSPDRAKTVLADASDRLQEVVEEARDRFDLVPRREFERTRAELAELRTRIERLEGLRHPSLQEPQDQPPEAGSAGIPVD